MDIFFSEISKGSLEESSGYIALTVQDNMQNTGGETSPRIIIKITDTFYAERNVKE